MVHRTLNREADILDLTDEYWSYRDSIVQAELLAMRMVNFKVINPNIHLVYYSYQSSFIWGSHGNLFNFLTLNFVFTVLVDLSQDTGIMDPTCSVGEMWTCQALLDTPAGFPQQQSHHPAWASIDSRRSDFLRSPNVRHHDPLHHGERSDSLARGIYNYQVQVTLALSSSRMSSYPGSLQGRQEGRHLECPRPAHDHVWER